MNRPVVVGLLLSLGLILGLALSLIAPEPPESQAIEWLDTPRTLSNFSLNTEAGEFDSQSLMGQWTIVSFGFLHCPDVCPTSLSQLATLADSLAAKAIAQKVDFVFVSVDPGRDSVREVSQYVQHFDPSIRGVTGKSEQLNQFSEDLGIDYRVSAGVDNYRVAHSITFSIIDPEGVFVGRFRPGFDIPGLVRGLTSKIMEARSNLYSMQSAIGIGERR